MPAHSPRPPPSFRTVWLAWLCAFFLAALPTDADAGTDFDRMEQLARAEYGPRAAETIKAWRALIESSQTQPDLTKLSRANDFANIHIAYATDMQVWGVEDYWATPLEAFGKGAGDCEDYAIAKYVTLLQMGIPVQQLRLVYVRARLDGQILAHMVLSYFETPTSDPLILDNLRDSILPAKRRPDLFPVFSFNHEGLWMEGERTSAGDPTSRLSRWRGVLQRMRREGIDPYLTTLSARSLLSWKKPQLRPSLRSVAQARPSVKGGAKAKLLLSPKLAAKSQPHLKTGKTASVHLTSTAKVKTTKTKAMKHQPPLRRVARR